MLFGMLGGSIQVEGSVCFGLFVPMMISPTLPTLPTCKLQIETCIPCTLYNRATRVSNKRSCAFIFDAASHVHAEMLTTDHPGKTKLDAVHSLSSVQAAKH